MADLELMLRRIPSHERERFLLRRFREHGDVRARDALVVGCLPHAARLARRFAHSGELHEDLVQVAAIGLLKAVDRFDPGRGVAFSTFAIPTVSGELKRHLRDSAWSVRIPRELKERALRVRRIRQERVAAGGEASSPTTEEIARAAGLTPEETREAWLAAQAFRALPLEERDDGGDGEREWTRAESRAMLDQLLRRLDARDREILRLRFEEDLTLARIGERMGLSQVHVSRLIAGALERMRALVAAPTTP